MILNKFTTEELMNELIKRIKFNDEVLMKMADELNDYEERDRLQEDLYYYQNYGADMLHENNELQQRINKAIEYIKEQLKFGEFDVMDAKVVLSMLEGEDK